MIQNRSLRFGGNSRTFSVYTNTYSLLDRFYFQFLFGLNKETERWVKDGIFSNGGSLQSRSEEEVFYLFEDMANFDYHCHLSQHNTQQQRDPFEDQIRALIEMQKKSMEEIEQLK